MSDKTVLVEVSDRICTITLNRPKIMNAMNQALTLELLEAFTAVSEDDAVHVVILEGAGGNFTSGADMNLLHETHGVHEWLDGMRTLGRLICTMREAPQPIIAKLRGAAYGGGSNLALAADFVVAANNAKFCENFVHIGTILDAGGTYFLPRLVGHVRARELALLGEPIDGETAASMGLIYKAVSDDALDREVADLAQKLSQKSLRAMALIKEGLEASFEKSLKETMNWEAAYQAIMLQSPEHKEIIRMFIEARKHKD